MQKTPTEANLMKLQSSNSVRKSRQKRRDRVSNSAVDHNTESVTTSVKSVVVAVNAEKVTRHALEWALTSIVQSGDQVTLLALLPVGRKLWNLSLFSGDCAHALRRAPKKHSRLNDLEDEIKDICSSMMEDLHALCDMKKARVNVKVVSAGGGHPGAIAIEARQIGASWVVLDKHLKREVKFCMDQLRCNLVLVTQRNSKILRLNFKGSGDPLQERTQFGKAVAHLRDEHFDNPAESSSRRTSKSKGKAAFTASSDADSCVNNPGVETPSTATETGTSSVCSPATPVLTVGQHRPFSDPTLTCLDSTIQDNGAVSCFEYPSDEANSITDYGVCDFLWECNGDRSGPLCTPASGSPENSEEGIFDKSFCLIAKPWAETTFLAEGSFTGHWKPASITASGPYSSPNSERTTPGRSSPAQGPASNSPSPSNRGRPSTNSRSSSFSVQDNPENSFPTSPPARNDDGGVSGTSCSSKAGTWRGGDLGKLSRQPVDGGKSRDVLMREELQRFSEWDGKIRSTRRALENMVVGAADLERTSSVRRAMSLSRHHVPAGPPPLCSICQHKAPVFGKPPRRFSYSELELATGGFSRANFLAEGGFGSVHRGLLPDGQAVAVKQHKPASSQGDIEFCSEVEVLSCAQHRNVVMLIGYCVEDKKRLLVYEFVCNSSLDSHLYGADREALPWAARQKIAVGAARGLRYLHEECRVGCIIHRDMRPNNILLTHDFEPMVGDFGLARWQPDGDLGIETRVIGTLGYLAPEYAQSGQVTEKADVYSFGVVLLELATGRKAVDITRPKGQQCLTEWARPLLEEGVMHHQTDPRLQGEYAEYELNCLLHAASLCIGKDPQLRPKMSQVLRILEGDIVIDTSGKLGYEAAAVYDGSRSGRMTGDYHQRAGSVSPPLISYSGSLLLPTSKLSYEALRAAYLPM